MPTTSTGKKREFAGANLQSGPTAETGLSTLETLERIQKRVLWLSTNIIHYANFVRPNPDGGKVGGHQASSASMVSLMTALYFHSLRPGDRVAVKPHASPVFHAIQYLLGRLPAEKLKQLRSFHGLQAYPSRTKDIDGVDFSTGSVGLGAVAPNFAALTQQFIQDHFEHRAGNRMIATVGDAELDEGNVWEALGEESLRSLGQVLWIVDLNRQSLDRVVPSGRAQKIEEMFRVNGWHVLELKYGRRLEEAFARPHGEKLRRRIDLMTNEEYQSLLRLEDGERIRENLARGDREARDNNDLLEVLRPYSAQAVKELIADLGGHDLTKILAALAEADRLHDRPVVIVAYTVKGWGLPLAGDPLNHSKFLTVGQIEELRQRLEIPEGEDFPGFADGSPEARCIHARREFLTLPAAVTPARQSAQLVIPDTLDSSYQGELSTQQALGSVLIDLSRIPEIASRIVTTSPDVAISTNLAGWINKTGVYCHQASTNYFRESAIPQALNWEQTPRGHHLELGISENNFFSLLNMLGLAQEFSGETLLPIGTIYDPFICRGLDALIYAAYSGSKFIFAGTPSGISLSAEGGAHQSLLSPSIGMQLPNLVYYEPAFAQELEWILLAGLRNLLDRKHGQIVYLRLSTRPIPQQLFPRESLQDAAGAGALRDNVLRGGYRIVDLRGEAGYRPGVNVVNVFATGVMVANAVAAARQLQAEGVFANVVNVTSPDLLYRSWQNANRLKMTNPAARLSFHLERLVPAEERQTPIVTVLDGHPQTLAFLGSVFGTKTVALGVDEFGQSGGREELYEHYGISTEAITRACRLAIKS